MSRRKHLKNSFSSLRRFGIGVNVFLSILVAFVVLVLLNYIATLHFYRFHWSGDAQYKLTPYTREVLTTLTNDVHITIFFDRQDPVYHSVSSLLNEYQSQSRHIDVETVDYLRNPAIAEKVKQEHDFSFVGNKNLVLLDNEQDTEVIYADQLSSYSMPKGKSRRLRRTAFKGEQFFTSAILDLTTRHELHAYFLQGHREHDPESTADMAGYSKFAGILGRNNVQVDKLRLGGTNNVPDDCDLLIAAGPQDAFLEKERKKIESYLEKGGRLLALLRAPMKTGLAPLFRKWEVDIGQNVVVDPANSISARHLDMAVTNFGMHEIVRPLYDSQLYLYLPRSVEKVEKGSEAADTPEVHELFYTSPGGEVRTDIRDGLAYASPTDRKGEIPLAVAVKKGGIEGVSSSDEATRIVVIGDSLLFGNTRITNYANSDLAALVINWLLDRAQLTDKIPPRTVEEYQLNLTREDRAKARWILLAGMPGGILALGLIVWWTRRR